MTFSKFHSDKLHEMTGIHFSPKVKNRWLVSEMGLFLVASPARRKVANIRIETARTQDYLTFRLCRIATIVKSVIPAFMVSWMPTNASSVCDYEIDEPLCCRCNGLDGLL
jgi:hypothetical protein